LGRVKVNRFVFKKHFNAERPDDFKQDADINNFRHSVKIDLTPTKESRRQQSQCGVLAAAHLNNSFQPPSPDHSQSRH
jgi:hypothetical protein